MAMKIFDKAPRPQPDHEHHSGSEWSPCPVCQTYGGWKEWVGKGAARDLLGINCGQCNGWGWVGGKDAKCVHEREPISPERVAELGYQHWGMHCHAYECKKCHTVTMYDSSD